MSDLVNDPSRPACGCDHCTKHATAWADGTILEPALATVGLAVSGPPPGASIAEVARHERAVAAAWWARYRQEAWEQLGLRRPDAFVSLSVEFAAFRAAVRSAASVLPPPAFFAIDGTAG